MGLRSIIVEVAILPVLNEITICERYTGYPNGRVDLYGLFNTIHASDGFPCAIESFCLFAQLTNGEGVYDFFVRVANADRKSVVRQTDTYRLRFGAITEVTQVALYLEDVRFTEPGKYLIELFCADDLVCETVLLIK
jgi:hypothetical protein